MIIRPALGSFLWSIVTNHLSRKVAEIYKPRRLAGYDRDRLGSRDVIIHQETTAVCGLGAVVHGYLYLARTDGF